MQILYKICLLLAIVGGLNWGLIGLFQFDAVAWLCGGSATIVARIIYTLVGVGSICSIPLLFTIGDDGAAHLDAH